MTDHHLWYSLVTNNTTGCDIGCEFTFASDTSVHGALSSTTMIISHLPLNGIIYIETIGSPVWYILCLDCQYYTFGVWLRLINQRLQIYQFVIGVIWLICDHYSLSLPNSLIIYYPYEFCCLCWCWRLSFFRFFCNFVFNYCLGIMLILNKNSNSRRRWSLISISETMVTIREAKLKGILPLVRFGWHELKLIMVCIRGFTVQIC